MILQVIDADVDVDVVIVERVFQINALAIKSPF